jgi:hypothetical protein
MLHLDERTMGYVIQGRQELLAETMAASQQRSMLVSRLGAMLVYIGEKLRGCPTAEEIMALHRRTSRPRPGLTQA